MSTKSTQTTTRQTAAPPTTATTWKITSLLAVSLLALAACEDPAKNKAKAITGEATPSSVGTAAAAGTLRYDFDQSSSKVEWVGSKVTGKHEGGFRTFNGNVSYVGGSLEKSAVTVDIAADSLYTDSEKLVGHLKSPDFFDVAKFPTATFASTQVKSGGDKGASHTVTGNFTLHGVTKSITFPANIKAASGGVDVDAEFAINRKDFGLVYAGKPDDLIREDVVIKLTIRSQKRS